MIARLAEISTPHMFAKTLIVCYIFCSRATGLSKHRNAESEERNRFQAFIGAGSTGAAAKDFLFGFAVTH